jgi:hypothetical protein
MIEYNIMPNLLKVYTDLTKFPSEDEKKFMQEVNPADDAARTQALSNWKHSSITKEKIQKHEMEYAKLVNESIKLAVSYPTHKNFEQIVQNLVKANTLIEIITEYGN